MARDSLVTLCTSLAGSCYWSSSPLVTGREGSLWKRYGSGFGLFEATRLEGEGYEIGDCPSLIYSSEGVLPYPQQSFLFSRDMVQKGFVAVPFCHVKATADWIVFSQTVPTRPNDLGQVDRWRNLGSRADRSRIRFSYDGSSILSALIRFPVSCCWCGGRRDEVRAIRLFEEILMDRSCPVARRCSVLLEGIALP